jgi:hypothetical protein
MILGLWVIIGLFFWMSAEVTILLFSNKELVLSSFDRREGEDITSESREYNIRALALSGLTFAGIALLIDAFSHNIQGAVDTIIILAYSFGLFLCSYRIEVLTNYRRLYWIMQEKCLNFGFLGLISSLVVFFYIVGITIILAVFSAFLGVIILIHFIELRSDFKYYSERSAPKKNKI